MATVSTPMTRLDSRSPQIVALQMEFLKRVGKLCYGLSASGCARLWVSLSWGLGSPRRRRQGRVMRNQLCLSALAWVLGVAVWPTVATAQPAKAPTTVGQPAAAVQPATTPDICYVGSGLTPKQRIKTCSDVIDSGAVKGLGLGLAYFNRGVARANDGDP